MAYLRALWITEISAAACLFVCAIIFAVISALSAGPTSALAPKDAAVIVFWYTLIIGAIPALVFGAPLYALLRSRRRHKVWLAVALGLIPAGALALADSSLAPHAFGAAALVAAGTHYAVAMVKE